MSPVKSPLAVGVGAPQERVAIFEAQTVVIQQRGIHFDANRRQRASADRYLADALDLR